MKFGPVVKQALLGVLLLGFCLVMAGTTVAQSQYYVNSSAGSDSNDGSQARPWKTLQHADSAAALGGAGTVIHVADGNYNETLRLSKGGTSDSARFEWQCDNQSNASKNWPCHLTGGQAVILTGNYVSFVGFDYSSNSGNDPYAVQALGSYNHLQNNRIHDTVGTCTDLGGAGISVGNPAHDNLQGEVITGNWIFNTNNNSGGWGNRCHGLYIVSSATIIENNVIFNNKQGYGIKYSPSAVGGLPTAVISNNTLWGNGGSHACPSGPTPCTTGGPAGGCMIISQDRASQNPNNMTVNNNICYVNPGTFQGLNFYPDDSVGAGSVLKNNVMFGNGSNTISGLASGTVFSAPNFTNFKADGSGDYTPTSSLPLMSGGSTVCGGAMTPCVPSIDFAGVARVTATLDIGAFAQGSSTASGVPSAPTGLTASVQ